MQSSEPEDRICNQRAVRADVPGHSQTAYVGERYCSAVSSCGSADTDGRTHHHITPDGVPQRRSCVLLLTLNPQIQEL